jgi:hypothetical protein
MNNRYKEWSNYLLNIGVTNLSDEDEISRKLEEVERSNPEYKSTLINVVEEGITITSKPIELLTKEDITNWLLSLGD